MVPKLILFPETLVVQVDAERGDVPFAVFVRRAVEEHLASRALSVPPDGLSSPFRSVAYLDPDGAPAVINATLSIPPPSPSEVARAVAEVLYSDLPGSFPHPDAPPEPSTHLLSDSIAEVVKAKRGTPPKRRRASSEDKDCMHPVTRRIGNACGQCGAAVKA